MIKRTLLSGLEDHLPSKEISLIIGPRQSGKTTLMLALQKALEAQGLPSLFFNLDIESDMKHLTSQEAFLNKIRLEVGSRKAFVFVDEIQRKENAGLFLKGLYDMSLPFKFIVSGSGSVELKEKIHESLTGRKRIFELNPLSFAEFANHRTDYRYEDRLREYFDSEPERAQHLLDEYLGFGGYPRVVLAENIAEKQREIGEIFQSYIEKDIAYLLQVKKTESFSRLIRVLAVQLGRLVNISGLSSEVGIAAPTVKGYLWYLEKTFIVRRLTPFFRNVRKEIRKSPLVYFYDLGLRNYGAGSFGRLNANEAGFVFQNFIFNWLKEAMADSPVEIHFWHTADQAEVDFILDFAREAVPLEVKYSPLRKPTVPRGLRSFIEHYAPAKAYVVNCALRAAVDLNKTKIYFVPYWDLARIIHELRS
jgi:predicted AAA+ superfamily ATPase